MEPIATAQSNREAEAAWFAAHPGGDLMGLAAAAVTRSSAELLAGRERLGVLVVAGPGNNAGDALFAAAGLPELTGANMPIWVWPVAGTTHPDGLIASLDAGAVVVAAEDALRLCSSVGLLIDGVSGLGGRPGLPADVAAVARAAHDAGVPVVAVDIPSGLVADSCEDHESFAADLTVTFIARKLAHVAEPAASVCGRVELVDIGVTPPPSDVHLVSRTYLSESSPDELLTVDAGELAQLLGTEWAAVEADPLGRVRHAATRTGAPILLTGATQYRAAPDGSVLIARNT